ncbi:MAG: glycosyltransferase [Nanoarchaeota archaeon]|nr:glycosyltransferase [Nanoarchaeota archaeon]
MKDWTLVIPAYNEEKRIKQTLDSIQNVLGNEINVLVVSNGSKDKTVEILKNWKKEHVNFEFLDFNEKLGKGGAILKGLREVKTKYAGFIDADDSFDLNYVKNIIKNFGNNDVIIASKWKDRSFFNVSEPFMRKFSSRTWNLLARFFLNLRFRDTQAGAKFFKKSAFDAIDKKFICKGFSFDTELLFKFNKADFKIKEVYIKTIHREGSTFAYKQVIPMFKDLLKLWWSK